MKERSGGIAIPSTSLFGFCRVCKKPIRGGHLSGPDGQTHWGCYRDPDGTHPYSEAGFKRRGKANATVHLRDRSAAEGT